MENIVYYKDNTHYFVMTAKKQSLLDKGVIIHVSGHFNLGCTCTERYRTHVAVSFSKLCVCVFLVCMGLEHWDLRHLWPHFITVPSGTNHSLQLCVCVCVNLTPGFSHVCGTICSQRGLEGDVPLLTETLSGRPLKSISCAFPYTHDDRQLGVANMMHTLLYHITKRHFWNR